MATVLGRGRTGIVYRVEYGLVCKVRHRPNCQSLDAEFKNAFAVEEQLLKRLGVHPGIVRYRGLSEAEGMKDGLLLDEANCGTLQSYIDGDSKIDDALRIKWSLQIAKALAYVHEKGIIHSNLSTTNVLVHKTGQGLDLLLADFGGSRCLELDLDGNLLPDHAYLDPQATAADFQSPKLDVFSLGIVLYIIITGHYPFYQGPAPQDEERFTYGDRVRALYKKGKFPDLSGVLFGGVIAGCCCERRFKTAREVVVALEAEMQHVRKPTLLPFILKLTWRRGSSLGW